MIGMPKQAHGSLRSDLQRTWEQLENLPAHAVVLDAHGHAWQKAGLGYWYRAFDGNGLSSYEVAQSAETVTVMTSDADR